MFLRINGVLHYLWRAVDQHGAVLDILVHGRRYANAAKRFFKRLLASLQYKPRKIVTDGRRTHDRLHHFVSAGIWDMAPLEAELVVQADRLVGGPSACLVIDDTALPKKGSHSVGVAPQYASALGKTANCQRLVSLTLARDEVPLPVALRLFLPETWTADPVRLERAGVPEERRGFRTKPEMALAELDRLIEAGLRFGCALADAGYGLSAPFRQGLSAHGLAWAVGIPRHQKGYPADVALIFPGPVWPTAPAAWAGPRLAGGRDRVGHHALAPHPWAARDNGQAGGPVGRTAGAGGRWPAAAHRRHGGPAQAR